MYMSKEYLSAFEAAKLYGCTSTAIHAYIKRGKLCWDKVVEQRFGAKRIKKADLETFMENQNPLMVDSRRANAYKVDGLKKGYLTINQFASKYNITVYQLRKLVKQGILEFDLIEGRGWKLLPERETCEKLGIKRNEGNQGGNGDSQGI